MTKLDITLFGWERTDHGDCTVYTLPWGFT